MVKKYDLYNTPPEENEEETLEEEAPMRSQFLSEANDDAQLEYTPEEPLTETELKDDSQPPLTAQERYANVLKQASAAGPRASDYRAAALSRMFSGIGASTPGYLSRMSQTLYHKPDFSWLGAGQKDLAAIGDYDIKAKEAEKKRLVDKAAGIRQEALLPGEMAAQEAKSQEAQARLEALKPASQEELDAYEERTGTKLPATTTKATLASLNEKALTPMSEYERKRLEQAGLRLDVTKTGQEQAQQRAEVKRSEGQTKTFSELMRKESKAYRDTVKKQEESLADADKIATLANSDDWQSFNAVAPRFAKVIGGDSGVLTDKDIQRYSDSPELIRKYKDLLSKMVTGTPSEETKQGYVRAVQEISKTIKKKIADRQKEAKTRIKNDRLFKSLKGTDQEINEQIFGGSYYGDEVAETAPAPTQPKQPVGEDKVKVIKPDGTEGHIPRRMLKRAIEKGYKEIKE